MRKDQRAWHSIVQKDVPSKEIGSSLSTVLITKNTGKTPALHTSGMAWIKIIPNGEEPNFEDKTSPQMNWIQALLQPTDTDERPISRMSSIPGPNGVFSETAITQQENQAIMEHRAGTAVYGSLSTTTSSRLNIGLNFVSLPCKDPVTFPIGRALNTTVKTRIR